MTSLQRSFYDRHYRPAFLTGNAIDLDGQHGYARVMLHELLETWDTDEDEAMAGMRLLIESYPETSLFTDARQCLADMHYLRGEWAEGLAQTRGLRQFTAFVNLGGMPHPRADPALVLSRGTPSITKSGLKNLDAALSDLQDELDAFHDEHGVSLVEQFWARLLAEEPVQELAVSIQEQIGTAYSVERIVELITFGRSLSPVTMTAFERYEASRRPIPTPSPWSNPYAFEGLWRTLFRRLFRDSENRARESAGLPRVGEGPVSEIRLLRELRNTFPDERLNHQVRPGWLTPQSLDIVFAGRDLAIEYQGAQHSRPVEFFGGQAAFEKQQERDFTKRWLCKKHGMNLIEVHPDYELSHLVTEIRMALNA